tara:strand:+ start:21442 stop:21843 length:402 start_codon:yes stop_codon:yes gene_type:complete
VGERGKAEAQHGREDDAIETRALLWRAMEQVIERRDEQRQHQTAKGTPCGDDRRGAEALRQKRGEREASAHQHLVEGQRNEARIAPPAGEFTGGEEASGREGDDAKAFHAARLPAIGKEGETGARPLTLFTVV